MGERGTLYSKSIDTRRSALNGHSNGIQSNPLNRIAFLPKNFMQLTEAVHHVLEDRKMTFARLCNYAGYAIIGPLRYAIKRVRLYPKIQ